LKITLIENIDINYQVVRSIKRILYFYRTFMHGNIKIKKSLFAHSELIIFRLGV